MCKPHLSHIAHTFSMGIAVDITRADSETNTLKNPSNWSFGGGPVTMSADHICVIWN